MSKVDNYSCNEVSDKSVTVSNEWLYVLEERIWILDKEKCFICKKCLVDNTCDFLKRGRGEHWPFEFSV